MIDVVARLCGAPISWGVSEVPGWGEQLDSERVLGEMAALGLRAMESGPAGFLPAHPAAAAEVAGRHGLRIIGGFVPLVMHTPGRERALAGVHAAADFYAGVGGEVLVLAAAAESDDYEQKPHLAPQEWDDLLATLDACLDAARGRGLRCVLHPHVGTAVETPEHIERVYQGSRIPFCFDTGHVLAGGGDPVSVAAGIIDRVEHVHLKDVDAAKAADVVAGRTSFADAVDDGLFRPLGAGDVDVPEILRLLDARGYEGWFVLEQDIRLRPGSPPPAEDVAASIDVLRSAGAGPGGGGR